MMDILGWIVGSILSISIIAIILGWLAANPDAALTLAKHVFKLISRITDRVSKRLTATTVERDANVFFKSKVFTQVARSEGIRLKVKWVKEAEDPTLTKDGNLIVRLRKEDDPTRNSLAAVSSAVRIGMFPWARPFLKPSFAEAVDLQVVRKLAHHLGAHAERTFAVHFLEPRTTRDAELLNLIGQLQLVDDAGLFEAVLLQELFSLADRWRLSPPAATVHEELVAFVEYLVAIATREPHDERSELMFRGDHIRVGIILLSKSVTAAQGAYPYLRRLGINLAEGARSIYLLGVTEAQSAFCGELTATMKGDPRVRHEKTIEIVARKGVSVTRLPLSYFTRNNLYIPEESFESALQRLDLSVGDKVMGHVQAISRRRATVEVHGLRGIVRSADAAWGYKGSGEGLIRLGPQPFKILEVDSDERQLVVGAKQLGASPWDNGAVPQVGSQQRVKVIEAGNAGIVVKLLDRELFGRIPVEEWSWRMEGSEGYVAPVEGFECDAVVQDLRPEHDDIVLSRRGLEPISWVDLKMRYPNGTRVRVTVLSTDRNGLVCELEDGVIGRISEGELRTAGHELADWKDTVVPGLRLDAVVKGAKERQKRFTLGLERNLK